MSAKRKGRAKDRRAIYILPNTFTTLSLFAGFYSIVAAIQGHYTYAAAAILIAAVCDALDGTVARMTGTTSRFGVEYDSLCDLVSFGVAPAVLVYLWALKPGKLSFLNQITPDDKTMTLGMLAAFIFLACGALRLARFNVSAGHRDPGFFQGLPIPGGAALIAAAVLWHYRAPNALPYVPNSLFTLLLVILLAFLMVSNLDYFSLKHRVILKNNHPFETLVLLILILAVVIVKAKTVLLPIGLVYIASGPIVTVVRGTRRGSSPPAPPGQTPAEKTGERGEENSP
ncbi:MAG: CDP-diacylglycerol--serine O-phosphatidyltransferase [Deltaproteobacteria bacterium]|jgi:CDP-diacylglycerol--serine O-phosphatidyltransferase|nr:CDP-diacylglycerol--serine O-phosphatidyltransferase [Deltaproteobacteria bacterium]